MNEETLTVMFSSKNPNCRTPKAFFDMLDSVHHFTTDVGACKEDALKPDYLGLDNGRDALANEWGSINFCNPPYGRNIGRWVKKGYDESLKYTDIGSPVLNGRKIVVMLLPGRIDTAWFMDNVFGKAAEVGIVKGRIKFDSGPHVHKGKCLGCDRRFSVAQTLEDHVEDCGEPHGVLVPVIENCTERHPAPFPSIVVVFNDELFLRNGETKWTVIEKPEGE